MSPVRAGSGKLSVLIQHILGIVELGVIVGGVRLVSAERVIRRVSTLRAQPHDESWSRTRDTGSLRSSLA